MKKRDVVFYPVPKLLSGEEFNNYYYLHKNGDKKAREILIMHNIRLVVGRVLNVYTSYPKDKNDLISCGVIGLVKAVDDFDIERKVAFSTFATKYIDCEIHTYMHRDEKGPGMFSYDQVISEDYPLTFIDCIIDESVDFVTEYEKKDINNQLMSCMSQLSKRCTMMYFGFYDNKVYTKTKIG